MNNNNNNTMSDGKRKEIILSFFLLSFSESYNKRFRRREQTNYVMHNIHNILTTMRRES